MCTAVHCDSPFCQNMKKKIQLKSQCMNLERGGEGNLTLIPFEHIPPPKIENILKLHIFLHK